jgi:hypothetical protein
MSKKKNYWPRRQILAAAKKLPALTVPWLTINVGLIAIFLVSSGFKLVLNQGWVFTKLLKIYKRSGLDH